MDGVGRAAYTGYTLVDLVAFWKAEGTFLGAPIPLLPRCHPQGAAKVDSTISVEILLAMTPFRGGATVSQEPSYMA